MRKIPKKRLRKQFAPAIPSSTQTLMALLHCDAVDSRILTWLYGRTWGGLKREIDEDKNVWAWVNEGRPTLIADIITGLHLDENEQAYYLRELKSMGLSLEQTIKALEELSTELDKETMDTMKNRLNKLTTAKFLKIEWVGNETAIIQINYRLFHPKYFDKDPLSYFREEE